MSPFFVYMLRCADGSFYVGHTDDLETRIAQHQAGSHDGYTARRRPVELVYQATFPTRDDAFAREQQLTGWSRAKKEALIRGDWESLHQLAKRRPSTPGEPAGPPSAQDERGKRATSPSTPGEPAGPPSAQDERGKRGR